MRVGAVRGLRDEVADMRAVCREEFAEMRVTMEFLRENYTSETRNGTQDSQCTLSSLGTLTQMTRELTL